MQPAGSNLAARLETISMQIEFSDDAASKKLAYEPLREVLDTLGEKLSASDIKALKDLQRVIKNDSSAPTDIMGKINQIASKAEVSPAALPPIQMVEAEEPTEAEQAVIDRIADAIVKLQNNENVDETVSHIRLFLPQLTWTRHPEVKILSQTLNSELKRLKVDPEFIKKFHEAAEIDDPEFKKTSETATSAAILKTTKGQPSKKAEVKDISGNDDVVRFGEQFRKEDVLWTAFILDVPVGVMDRWKDFNPMAELVGYLHANNKLRSLGKLMPHMGAADIADKYQPNSEIKINQRNIALRNIADGLSEYDYSRMKGFTDINYNASRYVNSDFYKFKDTLDKFGLDGLRKILFDSGRADLAFKIDELNRP